MDSKSLNVAVFIGSDIQLGGGYSYEYTVLDAIKKYHKDSDICFKYFTKNKRVKKDYAKLNLPIMVIKENIFQEIHRFCLSNVFLYRLLKKIKLNCSSIEKDLINCDIDIVYLSPKYGIAHTLINIPFVFTLWDFGHLDFPEFPEVSYDGKFEQREYLLTKSLKKAFKVIVESNYGKKQLIKKYHLSSNRIEVLRMLPNISILNQGKYIDIKKKYNIKNDYIFYPAQFWAHKNHIYILKTLKILKNNNMKISAVFSGSDKGNLQYILRKAKDYEVEDMVHYIGFVPNEEMPFLYKQSLSLVMPTYLGPTNIPPLEAFSLGVPVCYSDKPYFREQVGEAAFFMDLSNPQSLADCLIKIKNNDELVNNKIQEGKKLIDNWSNEDFYNKLLSIFKEYKYIRDLWA